MSRYFVLASLFAAAAVAGCNRDNTARFAWGDCNDSGCFGCIDDTKKDCWPLPYQACSGPEHQCEGGAVCTTIGCAATCHADTDCRQGEVCNAGGFCAPGNMHPTPVVPGTVIACAKDTDCLRGYTCTGGTCSHAATCGLPATLCTATDQCGTGRTCFEGACHFICGQSGPCPLGQACSSGACIDLAPLKAECLFDNDCGAAYRCLNAVCHPLCGTDNQCGTGAFCDAGVCRADMRPTASAAH